MNYKNIKSGVVKSGMVISSDDYHRLPHRLQKLFVGTYDSVTYGARPSQYSNDDDFGWIETAIGVSAIESTFDTSNLDTDISFDTSSNDDIEFGGGDFGGAGAGDSW